MVEMLPFCGTRYAAQYAKPQVFAPPYDVISPEMREYWASLDRYNIAHIDVSPAGAEPSWYEQAARQLRAWMEEGVLVTDQAPAYYAYEQHFQPHGTASYVRRGVFALIRLAPWGEGIYRHEHTRAAPRADRLNLMRATRAQLSPVFGIIDDPQLQLSGWLQTSRHPVVDYVDNEGVRQVFWPIDEPALVSTIRHFLSDKDIVIADGHHRYETALAYRDERRKLEQTPEGTQPYDYVLMYITTLQDPGLCILPTHRVITNGPVVPVEVLQEQLSSHLALRDAAVDQPLEDQIQALAHTGTVFGLYLNQQTRWICQFRPETAGISPQEAQSVLDVSILQQYVLEPCFGIDANALHASDRVAYTTSEAEACAMVDSGRAQAACILNATRLEQVWQTAHQLQTMPQKSTYFYPKLLTGLVLHIL